MLRELTLLALAPLAVAQVPTEHTVVLTQAAAPAVAQVLAVRADGTVVPFGRFPSDTAAPQAVAVDPNDRHVLVAVAIPGGSRVLRLLPGPGLGFSGELPLADLPGVCTQMEVHGDQLQCVVGGTAGGIFRLPRRGGAVTSVPLARASAMASFGGSFAIVGWSGSALPGQTDPGLVHLDLDSGSVSYGPFAFTNLPGRQLVGLIDLPTALSRQLLAFDDGTFWLHVGGLGDPTPVAMTPQPPAGGAQAFKADGYGFAGLAVGGASHPYLYRADWTGAVTVLATLPGSPVDLAPPLPPYPQVLEFGASCGAPGLQWVNGVMGPPQVGNLSFDLRVGAAAPNQVVVFVAGFSDVLGGVLPFALPGGCLLHTSPDAVAFLLTNIGGGARQALPIPGQPAFAGLVLFAQWLQPQGAGLATTAGAAVQIGL